MSGLLGVISATILVGAASANPADAPPDLGLVAIALATFIVGLTAVAAGLAFARRRETPLSDKPDKADQPDQPDQP